MYFNWPFIITFIIVVGVWSEYRYYRGKIDLAIAIHPRILQIYLDGVHHGATEVARHLRENGYIKEEMIEVDMKDET
jgi:hypothetical protein